MSNEITLDDFREYFPYAPTALSIKECVRLSRTRGLDCPSPILDVGCGDGLFAKLAFQNAEVWGIDIDSREARRAQASRAYEQIVLADITRAKLPDGFFASCLANCSLEHIPDLGAALRNIHRSLKPGAPFYTFLPNKDWARYMTSAQTSRTRTAGAATSSRPASSWTPWSPLAAPRPRAPSRPSSCPPPSGGSTRSSPAAGPSRPS
jgi:SAM-dependent methyltransferase